MLDGSSLGIEDVVAVARYGKKAALHPGALEKIEAARAMVEKLVREGQVVYGITTGFGRFSDVVISRDDVLKLQNNLIASHAAAVGDPLPEEVVRGAILLRVNALAIGHSGVRPVVVQQLLEMLNREVTPLVPGQGSLGASGDLLPVAYCPGANRARRSLLPGETAARSASPVRGGTAAPGPDGKRRTGFN